MFTYCNFNHFRYLTKYFFSTSKKQNREGQINICIPPEIKTEWKVLFASCNVNMTQGITFAIEHLKHEIDNGEAILTIGGVISKRK